MRLSSGARRTRVPLHVLLDEAVVVARFFDTYYPTLRNDDGTVARIGLDSVARPGRELTAATGAEVLSLREAIQEAQARYVAVSAPRRRPPLERMRFVLGEIRSALTFLFDDGKRDVQGAQLEQLASSPGSDSRSESALAMQLYQYATLAEMNRADLDGLGGFDVSLIDEAFALVDAIHSIEPAVPLADLPSGVLDLRQRLATLLADRMGTIRSAARFVFRRSPAIVREATSTYERRRGAAARARRADGDGDGRKTPQPPRKKKKRGAPPTSEEPS
jgi:hypothetical protein